MILVNEDEDGVFEYEIFGDAQTQIYLFQGYGGTLQKWSKEFVLNLSKSFQVITFNYPNVGKSKSFKEINSFDDYCDFFKNLFIKLNNGKKFVLLGYSMGIYVVRNILLKHKELLPEKIILCSGSFGGKYRLSSDPEIMAQLKTAGNDNLHLLFSKEKVISFNDYIKLFVHPTEEQSSKEVLDFQGKLIYNFFSAHCEDTLENKINFDTLVLHGLNDVIFSKKNAELLHSFCLKNSKLHFTNGGHLQLFEYPNETSDAIKQFCF